MKNISKLNIVWLFAFLFSMSSCYKEQHFSFPGYQGEDSVATEQFPFPFSADKSKGVYLIKDGVPDFSKIGFKGFTDFAFDQPVTNLSWHAAQDIYGRPFYGSRQHKNFYSDLHEDNFGNQKFSYECNDVYSRLYLKSGIGANWYFYTKMALTSLGHDTRCHFSCLGNKEFADRLIIGFDDGTWPDMKAQFFSYYEGARVETILTGVVGGQDHFKNDFDKFIVDEPFDYELICVNGFIYCRVEGEIIWMKDTKTDLHARPIIFRPMTNSVHFYDFYIEGDYHLLDMAAWQQENNYTTIQAPALIKSGDQILLFAEGRRENMIQTAQVDAVRSNATDIVMKTSSDGGNTWSELSLVTGNDGSVNMRPSVVKDENSGRLFLFYTIDATGDQTENYRVMMKTSDNNGQSWSSAAEIPCSVADGVISTIAGHGLQLEDGSLILPVKRTFSKSGTVLTLRSTDEGNTWTLGNPVAGQRNHYASLVELNADSLAMYIGHNGQGKSCKVVYSEDKGMTWTDPVDSPINTGNYGHQTSGATVKAGNRLVHYTANDFEKASVYSMASTPAAIHNYPKEIKEMYLYNAPDMGIGLTVTVSDDHGKNWSAPADVLSSRIPETYKNYKFRTGNMDAVLWDDNTVVCVCEGGMFLPYEGLVSFRTSLLNQ